jgi:hypothetical protein
MRERAPVVEFDYRPKRAATMAVTCLAVAGAGLLTYFAFTLDRPINVKGIQLTARQCRILFGTIACLTPIGLIPLIALVYAAFAFERRVALTSTSILLPKPTRMGLSREEIEIPFVSIRSAARTPFMGRTEVLRIDHDGGAVSIPSNMFADSGHFSQLCAMVQKAVSMAQSGQGSA